MPPRTQGIDFAEIRNGKRAGVFIIVGYAAVVITVTDRFSGRGAVCRRIGVQIPADGRIVPAGAGFDLFRCNHVPGIGGEHGGGFHRAHQARVKADKIKAVRQASLNALERFVEIRQIQAFVVIQLVKADAVDAAAAVIPQDQAYMTRRIGSQTPAQEIRQCLDLAP